MLGAAVGPAGAGARSTAPVLSGRSRGKRPAARGSRSPGGSAGPLREPGDAPAPPGPVPRGPVLAGTGYARSVSGGRIGVMGGTFDPIHHGHLVAASEVAGLFGLDEVVFVPTGQPWQKTERGVSPAEDRYLMTVIATASNPRFSVSRVDVDRGGPTYTIDTLSDLHRELADVDLPEGSVSLVEVPALAISSTGCRDRVHRGMPVWYLVPDGVVQYIEKRGLYHAGPPRAGDALPG